MWRQGTQRVEELAAEGERALVLLRVCLRNQKVYGLNVYAQYAQARQGERIKPGYFNPPGGRPIFVPGFNWLQVLVVGRKGPPTLHILNGGRLEGNARAANAKSKSRYWTKLILLHIWDRGFAGNPWLTLAFLYAVRFVLRWPKN